MNCQDSAERFDDYLDGCLNVTEAEELEIHLAGCAACAGEVESIRELRELAAGLPRTFEPSRDLWPGIAARISNQTVVRGVFGRRAYLVAAAAVVVVTSVVAAYVVGRSQAVITADSSVTAESAPSEILLVSFEGLGVTDYQATRTDLLDALEARRHELSPETMEVVMENLQLIDRALDRIAVALGEDPENEFLMKQLAGTYRRQIGLLQRAVRLPAEI